MIHPRMELIEQKVEQFKREFEIKKPRVDMSKICESKGWRIVNSEIANGRCEAITFGYKGFYEIHLPKDSRYWCRVKWSLAHEVSHIYLNHFGEFELSPIRAFQIGDQLVEALDREANCFAAEILMNREFIEENLFKGINFLRRSFGVSREAMRIRLDHLGLLSTVEAAATKEDNIENGPCDRSIHRL